jgi:hypothetical protein
MKKIKLFLVLFAIAIITSISMTSCKKYDEGPLVSFKSKQDRVANTWRFTRYILSGSDVTNIFLNSKLSLSKSGDVLWTDSGSSISGTWDFDSNKEKIIIRVSDSYEDVDENDDPITITESQTYSLFIYKLKESEMHLKGNMQYNCNYPANSTYTGSCEWKLIGN